MGGSYHNHHFLIELFRDSALIMRKSDNALLEFDSCGQEILRMYLSGWDAAQIAGGLSSRYDMNAHIIREDVDKMLAHIAAIGLTPGYLQDTSSGCFDDCSTHLSHSSITTQLAFHASSVVIKNKAILFAGDGGRGKSTLAEMLENKGHVVPGDEVAFVKPDSGGRWILVSALKKIDGQYKLIDLDHPPEIAIIVFLRHHLPHGFTFESCPAARAVKNTFGLLFCDRQNDPGYLPDAFRWAGLIYRQCRAFFLDFSKSIDFFSELMVIGKET
jgi:hypothetical protein